MKRICSFSNPTFYITMGDSEKAQQPSKKRAAQKELSRDNPGLDDEEYTSALENGTFKIASEEVLASRRIIEVKRKDPSSAPAPASNPFAGIRLVPCTAPAPAAETTKPLSGSNSSPSEGKLEIHDDGRSDTTKEINVSSEKEKSEAVNTGEGDKTKKTIEDAAGEEETKKTKDGCEDTEKDIEKNGDWGWSGVFTGLCRPPLFLAGKVPREGTKTTTVFPSKQDVLVETGEENEKAVFNADSILYEYLEGGWKERGIGELKVNVSTTDSRKARLVMRSKGNYRLILNASLYPEMKLAKMDKKGITFACVNSASEAKNGLSTFALKFKDPTLVSEFRAVIEEHKDGKTTAVAVEA